MPTPDDFQPAQTHAHAHAHAHGHHHHGAHSHGDPRDLNRKRLFAVLLLALSYAIIELVGGLWTGSLALLADSLHMVSDVAALGISLLASWMALRPASERRTFGNSRAEILAALANGLGLAVVAVFISVHAFERFMTPTNVAGAGVMVVAFGGLIINLVCLYLLEGGRADSLNVRGAWLHVASDAAASVGVMGAGLGIWAFGWMWLDPTVSLGVSVLVLFSAWTLIREALDVLMEAVPAHLDPEEIRDELLSIPGVGALHCLHVWTIGSGEVSLSSHLIIESRPGANVARGDRPPVDIDGQTEREAEEILRVVRERLTDRFGIAHSTIQLEWAQTASAATEEPACGEVCEMPPSAASAAHGAPLPSV